MSSIYYKTSGPQLVEILPLENNGPGNTSTPRQIVDVEFLDKSFLTPTDAFVVNDDVSARFVQGFTFDVIGGSVYDGSYVVGAAGFSPGDVVAQVVNGQTHVPVSSIVDGANPIVYEFFAGFTTPSISPTTPGTYLVTWQLAGDQTSVFLANSLVQFKHILYNDGVTDARVNRAYTVQSSTYNVLGFTNVVTVLTDEAPPASVMPIIGVDSQSVVVFPVPASAPLGYTQYALATPASSLSLVGRGSVMYNNDTSWGEAIQGNIIHVMENFANTTDPVSPMTGQEWFDTTSGPTSGPALKLYDGATWHGIVAEGLPVLGDINMNNHTIANVSDAVTTYPYVPSLTTWGNNDQEAMNLRTSDGLYIAKTGGYDTNPDHRSGTMSGSLSVTPYIESREVITTSVGTTGMLRLGATAQVGMSIKSNDGSFTYFDFVNASNQRTNITYTFGTKLLEFGKYLDEVVGAPAVSMNFSTGQVLTKKTTFADNQEFITKLYADSTYVNVTGDTMTGTLAMSGSADITLASGSVALTSGNVTLASGDITLGTGNNVINILNNGTAAGSIVFNTLGVVPSSGNNVINLAGNMLTGLSNAVNTTDAVSLQFADSRYINVAGDTMTGSLILNADPSTALGAATKQYVDMFASGIIWISPIIDHSLFDDTLSAPPTVDPYLAYHKSFIVAGTGTGDWTGYDGHLMYYDGTNWLSILGRPVAIGDRIGVFMEPANGDPLTNMPGGGVTGQAGKIATVASVSPYTYTFYTPAEPDAVTVVGVTVVGAAQSPHLGHSYTFRGVYGSGSYGTGYTWFEFLGPQNIIDGTGLTFAGSTLNVDGNLLSLSNLSTNGFVVRTATDTVTARTITGTASNIVVTNGDGVATNPIIDLATVTQGAVGTSFVKVALDGYGRVTNNLAVDGADITAALGYTPVDVSGDTMTGDLILNADPTVALGAVTKQYADVSRVMALAATVNGTIPASAKVLLAITAQPFTIDATPSATPSYGYADVTSTGAVSFDIQKNGVSIGSMDFAIGTNDATFTVASPVSFVAGDRIAVIAPVSPDATLADVYFTLRGTLV